ncbi:MAG: AI-2E family transporter, partial [Cyclobacteriaceae bacterium]|nr:AI-2E family transporter [Cyclobacteriaceae bacterium]
MRNKKISTVIILASLIVIIAGVMAAKAIILPIILALFISIICAQPILWLEKRKVPNILAIVIVLGSVALLFLVFGGIIGKSLSRFTNDAPKYEENLRQITLSTISYLNDFGANINPRQLVDLVDPGKILSFTAGAVGEIGGVMSNSFVIMLITIFMLLEVKSFTLKGDLIEKVHGNSLKYLDKIGQSIRSYLSIKTVVSFLTGIFIWIWLLVIGVDYAILWGVIAFLLNYIPNIGSIIAAAPTMLLALVQLGVGGMMWTGIGYLVVNLVMGNMVEPRVMGKGLGLSTLVVFLSLIVWGFILGAVGMFLSVPLTMTIKIVLEQNERTKWIAVLLGTEEETRKI